VPDVIAESGGPRASFEGRSAESQRQEALDDERKTETRAFNRG
jgi:hypothetical protein